MTSPEGVENLLSAPERLLLHGQEAPIACQLLYDFVQIWPPSKCQMLKAVSSLIICGAALHRN